jgi:hypothetical protein
MHTFLLSVVLLFGAPSPVPEPVIVVDACYRQMVWTINRIMDLEDDGLITEDQRQALVRKALEDYANCATKAARPPYAERRGPD